MSLLEVNMINDTFRRTVVCLAVAAALSALPAARAGSQTFRTSVGFDVGAPQKTFGGNLSGQVYGFSMVFAASPWQAPIEVGARFGCHFYGRDSFGVPLSAPFSDVLVDVTTNQGIIVTHLVTRVQPGNRRVQPYAEAAFGLSHLYSVTDFGGDDAEEAFAGKTHKADSVWSGGLGCGVEIALVKGSSSTPRADRSRLFLDGGVHRFWSGRARYVREGSLAKPEAFARPLEIQTSPVDLLTFTIGLGARF
jgi:hypothetical protein